MAKENGFVTSLVTTYRYLKQRGLLVGTKKSPTFTTTVLPLNHRSAQIEGNVREQTVHEMGYDVWEDGLDEIPRPSSLGETFAIVSTSANDTATGTGVQEVGLDLIDVDGNSVTVNVELNGTTEVVISGSYIFVNDMYASRNYLKTNGNYSVSAGIISIYKQGSPTTNKYSLIREGANKSLTCSRYIPTGYKYLIDSITATGDSKGVEGTIRATNTDNGIKVDGFLFKVPFQVSNNAVSIPLRTPIEIMENSIVKATLFSASGSVQNVSISILISGRLVPKTQ